MNVVIDKRHDDRTKKKKASEQLARKDLAFQKSYIAQCIDEIENASDNFKSDNW